jgi:hypothetical protein
VRRPEHLRELDRIMDLAFAEAIRLEHSFVSEEHFLLALLHPSRESEAGTALRSCGVTYEAVSDEFARMIRESDPPPDSFDPEAGIFLSFAGGQLFARAEGLSTGMGDPLPSEEHVLIAFLWDSWEEWLLKHCGTSRAEVYEQLRAQGVTLPTVPLPPTRVPPSGRHQRVDVPPERLPEVRSALLRLLPEDADWGWNVDPDTDRAWVAATGDDFDLERLVQDVLQHPRKPA